MLDQDRSVASGRAMADIAAGQGQGAQAFHGACPPRRQRMPFGTAAADSPPRRAPERRRSAPNRPERPGRRRCPDFIAPQLATLVERPPGGAGWAHEIKFDGYRIQLRVEAGRAVPAHPHRASTGRIASSHSARPRRRCRIAFSTARQSPSMRTATPISPCCNRRCRNVSRTSWCISRSTSCMTAPRICAQCRSPSASAGFKTLLQAHAVPALRYVDHFETGGDAVLQSACRMALEGIVSKSLAAAYRAGRGPDWVKSKCRAGH